MPSHFQQLQCWQLADKLRSEVHAVCASEVVTRDFKFCNSFKDAAGSVCRNLSEGFTRGTPGDIVQFFRYALASLAEVQDHLIECKTRGALVGDTFHRLWDLTEYTKATAINFQKPHQTRLNARRGRH